MTNELLQLLPEHERALGNKKYYEKELNKETVVRHDKQLRGDDGSADTGLNQVMEIFTFRKYFRKFANQFFFIV